MHQEHKSTLGLEFQAFGLVQLYKQITDIFGANAFCTK
jgi:hypothetical protein